MPTVQQLFSTDHPVALVTGSGAPRVGNWIARHLAQLGCHIVLHANSSIQNAEETAAELRASGTLTQIVHGPIQKTQAIHEIFTAIDRRFGRIDIAVNSAAVWEPKPLEEVTAQDVHDYLEVNTLGTFLVAQAAGLRMVDQPTGGAIVNLSDWAVQRPYLDHAAYFPSKGAVPTLTRSLAVELAERNRHVRVNCIAPGPVLLGPDVGEDERRATEEAVLLKRVGTPAHIAHAVQFLVENDFVTGVTLPVDGGRSIYANEPLQTRYKTG